MPSPYAAPGQTAQQHAQSENQPYYESAQDHNLHQLQEQPDPARAPSTGNTPAYSPQVDPANGEPGTQHAQQLPPDAHMGHAHAQNDLIAAQNERFAHEQRLAQQGVLEIPPDQQDALAHDPNHPLAHDQMQQQQQQHHHAYLDAAAGTPSSQKRSKVSRACDECRRKKIRCDAQEHVAGPCSNCRRSSTPCAFSRQPLKRGPSKGYIKSLASRVESLESQLGHTGSPDGQGPPQQHIQDANFFSGDDPSLLSSRFVEGPETGFSPPPRSDNRRKRTHSISENAQSLSRGSQYGAFSSQQRGQPTLNDAGPRPYPHQPMPPSQPHTPQAQAFDFVQNGQNRGHPSPPMHGVRYVPTDAAQKEQMQPLYQTEARDGQETLTAELDEGVIDEYYRLIHQTFPLLPHSRNELKRRVARCPPALQHAFCAALETAIRAYPATLLQPSLEAQQSERRAAELLASCQYIQPAGWPLENELVYLSAIVLMALESDNYGPETMRGQLRPPRGEWLGRAIGLATHLKLNVSRTRDLAGMLDRDTDEKLGRRIWWILFVLDRWHASSTSSLMLLPDSGSNLNHEDQLIVGESSYHLIRLSYILGHLTQISLEPDLMSSNSAARPIITTTILGEIDRFRESVDSILHGAPNLVHLSYWHVRLLVLRLTSTTAPHELLAPAVRMASILNSSHTMITPLNHHFAALAAVTLVELCEWEETRAGAEGGINDIIDALSGRRGFAGDQNSTGWDSAIRELVLRKRAQNSSAPASRPGALHHLADAAVGDGDNGRDAENGGASGAVGRREDWDASLMVRQGYLVYLVGDLAPGSASAPVPVRN